jgi:hypothetical protein
MVAGTNVAPAVAPGPVLDKDILLNHVSALPKLRSEDMGEIAESTFVYLQR